MHLNRWTHRYLRKSQYIIACITCMLLFFSIIIGSVENLSKLWIEDNNQLTKNYLELSFADNIQDERMLELINNIKKTENVILKYYLYTGFEDVDETVGIYFNGAFNMNYDLLEGRFFNPEDFRTDKKTAVIGKELLPYTKVENNKRYILRRLDKYEVIGVMGKKEFPSAYDGLVLYNLNSLLNNKERLLRGCWQVDSLTRNREELSAIISQIGGFEMQAIPFGPRRPTPLKSAIRWLQPLIASFILIILCILLTLVRVIFYWLDSIKQEMGLRKNYGATSSQIFWEIIKRYNLMAVVSLIISLILEYLLFKIKFLGLVNYQISPIHILLSIGFVLLIGIFFLTIAIYQINKTEINQLIKRM